MKTPNLPETLVPIYNAIKQKYSATFEPLKVGGTELSILQVNDLEPLLGGRDPFTDVESFPFWIKLWESALVLAELIAKLPVKPGDRLLELGAGLGAPGLAAAAVGHAVTLSDYEPLILDFQRINAAASNLTNVECTIIDWKNPPQLAPFDTIIGAEILFRDEFFQPLLDLFNSLLAPGGTVYLAHDQRRKSLAKFLTLAQADYEIATRPCTMKTEDETLTIIINRLRRKA